MADHPSMHLPTGGKNVAKREPLFVNNQPETTTVGPVHHADSSVPKVTTNLLSRGPQFGPAAQAFTSNPVGHSQAMADAAKVLRK